MSSFRSANGGASKPRVHNVNSVYSGKNTAAVKASGPGKHGLQSLGKATAVVRRMPPPATLPSLKAEHGQDPTIAIVPQGGTGWLKSNEESSTKQNGSAVIDNTNAPDLRPTWAKPVSGSTQESNQTSSTNTSPIQGTAAQIVARQVPANNRDFPSLAASVAAVGKDANASKPQKTNVWGTNLEDAQVEIPPLPQATQQLSSGGYIGAATAPKPNVDRKLPERYFSSNTTTTTRAGKVNIREKLARLSMESKEPSTDQESKPKQMEKEATPPPQAQPAALQQQQPPPQPSTTPQQNAFTNQSPQPQVQMNQPPPQVIQQPQQRMSQDVRQMHPHHYEQQTQPNPDWQQQPPPERYYEFDRHHAPPQNGRGEGGGFNRHHYGVPQDGYQRLDESMKQPYRSEQMEEMSWNHNDPRGLSQGMRHPPQGHPNRYRIDSRSSNEADGNWQGYPPRQKGLNQGWYDNGNYPHQHYDHQGGQYPPNNYGRNQDYRRSQGSEYDYNGYNNGPNYHEPEGRQNYRQQSQHGPSPVAHQQQPHQRVVQQQPEVPYRMLKRNDEKSAEYLSNHGGAVIPQSSPVNVELQQQRQPLHHQPMQKKQQQKDQKQKQQRENKEETPKEVQKTENVWEKRMEERKKEERNAKINSKYQQQLDYEFPSIDQHQSKDKEIGEWNNDSTRKTTKKSKNKEPDPESIGATHWQQKQTGPSWDNLSIPTDNRNGVEEVDDDVYTGNKKEFVNSRRNHRGGGTTTMSSRGKPSRIVGNLNGRKNSKKDNFSNMGEFHAEDYRFEEANSSKYNLRYHKNSDSVDDSSYDGSRKSKRIPKNTSRSWKKNDDDYENGDVDYYSKNKKNLPSKSSHTGRYSNRTFPTSSKMNYQRSKLNRDEKKPQKSSRDIVKSPISEAEQWETASESSDVGDRKRDDSKMDQKPKNPSTSINNNKPPTKSKINGISDEEKATEAAVTKPARSSQKNVKPASHTYPGNNAYVKNNGAYKNSNANNNQQSQSNKRDAKAGDYTKYARDNRKDHKRDELAGFDLNDASVIVIDNQPDVTDEYSENDFEEVMSKKQRKQKLEEEKRREMREKEKAERQLKKNKIIVNKKIEKKTDRKYQEKSSENSKISVSVDNVPQQQQKFESKSSPVVEPDLGTSVWNSVHVQPISANVIEEKKQNPHIPSPIARPTKSSITAASTVSNSMTINVNAVKDEYSTFGVATSTITTSSSSVTLYDIPSFNPKTSPIGTKPGQTNENDEILNSDHAVLKEKLDKVKDVWQGDDSTEVKGSTSNLSQAHGPNVAKVKPQPQLQDQQQMENKMKNIENCNVYAIPQSHSPNLYQQNPIYTMNQSNPFTSMQNSGYPIIYNTNEYVQPYNHQNTPSSHSVFSGTPINMMTQQTGTRPQTGYETAVYGSAWSNCLDFMGGINTQQQNRYPQQYNTSSRPNSGMSPTSIPPPPPINLQHPRQLNSFVPTHVPPPPITQPYPLNEFLNGPPPQPIGSNRNNGNRFPIQCPPQSLPQQPNYRQQQINQSHSQPQYNYQQQNQKNNSKSNSNNYQNNPQQNQKNQSQNWQKNQQQQNYNNYFNNVNSSKYGASQSTA